MKTHVFANINSAGEASIGTINPVAATLDDELMMLFRKKSGRTAFVNIGIDTAGADDDGDTDALAEVLGTAWSTVEKVRQAIAQGTAVEVEVERFGKPYSDLVPAENDLRKAGMEFVLDSEHFLREHIAANGRLKAGDRIYATPHSMEDGLVICRFAGRVDADERIARLQKNRGTYNRLIYLRQQLAAQAGKVFVVLKPEGEVITDKGKTFINMSFHGVPSFVNVYPDRMKPELTLADGSVRLPLAVSNKFEADQANISLYFENAIKAADKLPKTPAVLPEDHFNVVTGTVSCFDQDRFVVIAIFDDGAWSTGVFKYRKDNSLRVDESKQEAARNYIPVGYPCEFILDVKHDTGQSRLELMGVDFRLDGRMPFDRSSERFNTARHIASDVAMAPVCVRGDMLMMSSPAYTAFMPLEEAPENLRLMAECGVFSPQYTMRCNVDLVKLNPPENGKRCRVVCSPAKFAPEQLPLPGGLIHPRIVAGLDGKLFMMDGDVAAYCYVKDEPTFLGLLSGKLTASAYKVTGIDSTGFVTVAPERIVGHDRLDNVIAPGDLFCIGENMKYRDIPVRNVPDMEPVETGTPMLALGFDRTGGCIVATTRTSAMYVSASFENEYFRVAILPDCGSTGALIGRRLDDRKLVACTPDTPVADTILRRLTALFGKDATMVVETNMARDFMAGWSGIACQHDYSVLTADTIAASVVELWDEVPDDVPVLFGDIPLLRSDLPGLPPRRAVNTQTAESLGKYSLKKVKATTTNRNTVPPTLAVEFDDGTIVAGARNLRINFPVERYKRGSITPLDHIFKPGSEWAVEAHNDQWRIAIDDSPVASVYEILAPITTTETETDFVARSPKGTIAIAGNPGGLGKKLMAHYGINESGILRVIEAEEQFVGKKLCLKIGAITDTALVCSIVYGHTGRPVHIPLDRVSWNPAWKPTADIIGAACKARVISMGDGFLIADRRCLLHQDALLKGMEPDYGARYQMEVIGTDNYAYHLMQNGVEAWLPFERAALFDITPESRRFLRPGDLVEVRLFKPDAESKTIYADRISLLDSKRRELSEMALSRNTYIFTVHHSCAEGLFVELDGEVLFVDGRELGFWKGDSIGMNQDFSEGATINLAVEERDNGKFTLSEGLTVNTSTAPSEGERCHGKIISIIAGRGCYVHCGEWTAFVPEFKMSWKPLRLDHNTGLRTGREVDVVVDSVDLAERTITADIRATVQPGDSYIHTGFHRYAKTLAHNTEGWLMADTEGWLIHVPYSSAFERVKNLYLTSCGLIPVAGINPDGTLNGDMQPLADAITELRSRVNEATPEAPVVIDAKIVTVDAKKMVITAGNAVGSIPRKECGIKTARPLGSIYREGQTVKAVVTAATEAFKFNASIEEYRRLMAHREITTVKVGDRITVNINDADIYGVYGTFGNITVAVPATDVTRADDVTPIQWAESRSHAEVVVTDVSPARAELTASRILALHPDIEER